MEITFYWIPSHLSYTVYVYKTTCIVFREDIVSVCRYRLKDTRETLHGRNFSMYCAISVGLRLVHMFNGMANQSSMPIPHITGYYLRKTKQCKGKNKNLLFSIPKFDLDSV